MEKRTPQMLILSSFLIVVILAVGYYKVEMEKKNNIIAHLEADKSCDLQKTACQLKIPDGGDVTLSIEPRPIPLVKKFSINVQTKNVVTEAVSVDFKGTTMNMGPNNVSLKKASLKSTTQEPQGYIQFSGQGMLPVCIRNSMEWQADVYIQTDKGVIVAPFIFVTTH
ncbi:MAG: hypothetical protein GY694_05525 [Gammaproteobacteria bacterium]|nr:hypothetical protein [Gammaproteobacteria bacterium]